MDARRRILSNLVSVREIAEKLQRPEREVAVALLQLGYQPSEKVDGSDRYSPDAIEALRSLKEPGTIRGVW